jgi:flagellar basal-body rod protein FlgC
MDGMVHYPRVEAATEMATLVSATRAYEANIRAYNSLRAMNLKAFDIGK